MWEVEDGVRWGNGPFVIHVRNRREISRYRALRKPPSFDPFERGRLNALFAGLPGCSNGLQRWRLLGRRATDRAESTYDHQDAFDAPVVGLCVHRDFPLISTPYRKIGPELEFAFRARWPSP